MVFPILIAIVAAPALLGTQEAIRQSQSKEKREEHRARRCNLIASCVKSSRRSREINDRPIVLRNSKLWIDTGTSDGDAFGHPYAGYYLPYPDTKYEGLVTTITDAAPIMNWIYVDKETHEVKYGVRLDAQPNLTGPFDCTRQDRRLTFDGWEGWCAVEESPGLWALYFDRDDNGLRGKVAEGARVLEIELSRKEKRWKKDGEERQKDQTTKRAVDTKEDVPVDDPITVQPELTPPGVGVPSEDQAPKPLRPFALPKSIFSNPPRPLFFEQEMLPPRSPPPAYYKEGDPAPPVENIVLDPVHEPEKTQLPSKPQLAVRRSETPPSSIQNLSTSWEQSISAFETPRQAPIPPSRLDSETTPLAPAPLKVTPPTEKRPTPKLNRMSGTRAMSQAHMFEAWATDQTQSKDPILRKPASSRPISNTSTPSVYSDSPVIQEDEELQIYAESMTPPALAKGQAQSVNEFTVSDPAIFARLSSGSSTTSDPAVAKDHISNVAVQPTKDLNTSTLNEALPPLKSGVFRGDSKRSGPSVKQTFRSTSPNTTRELSKRRDRVISPELPRRSSPNAFRDPPQTVRNGASALTSRGTSSSRDRNGSISSKVSGSSRPIPTSRQRTETLPLGERSSLRPSVTRTNTAPAREGVARRGTTTSTLYREIDDLVRDGRNRSGSTVSNSGFSTRRDLGSENKDPSLRRTVTVREPQGYARIEARQDRSRETGRGSIRRSERENERR